MTIAVGDKIPDVTLSLAHEAGPEPVSTGRFFAGRKIALFAVPGAFTPTCSARHLPGYLDHADALRAAGIDAIVCVAVNDAFVLQAWAGSQSVHGRIEMLADGSALLTRAMGLELDLTARGMGVRSLRYAMIVDDGTVAHLAVEPGGEFGVSSAESVLAALG